MWGRRGGRLSRSGGSGRGLRVALLCIGAVRGRGAAAADIWVNGIAHARARALRAPSRPTTTLCSHFCVSCRTCPAPAGPAAYTASLTALRSSSDPIDRLFIYHRTTTLT